MNSNNHVSILCTGGTFEKAYGSGSKVRDFSFPEKSYVASLIERFQIPDVSIDYDRSRAKDSLDMTDADRIWIARWCRDNQSSRCVIVHGTDTMVETARVIAAQCRGKVVVLTGALQPARMRDSDAEFNLWGAIIAARNSKQGVYVVMGGQAYEWNKCQKNPVTGYFQSRES